MKQLLFLAALVLVALLVYRVCYYQPPPERHLAPVGTFFMTTYVSARTPTGIVGLTPGEEVRLIPGVHGQRTRLVTDGSHQFEVEPAYLTDDIDVGQRLRTTDQDRQKQAEAAVYAEKMAVETAKRKQDMELRKKAQEDLAQLRAAQAVRR